MYEIQPEAALGFLLHDASRLFRRSFDTSVEASGVKLTSGDARVLAYIAMYDGHQQSALAELMGVEPMTISAYLDSLQMKGLITRKPKQNDRRAKIIHMTEKGEKTFDELRPIANMVFEKAIAGIAMERVQTLETCLSMIRDNLSR